jgi:hypothetical protein
MQWRPAGGHEAVAQKRLEQREAGYCMNATHNPIYSSASGSSSEAFRTRRPETHQKNAL